MKKLFLLLVVVAIATATFAQDVIITSNAQRIEAKILEVSSNEIKYKEFNNPDGPTFVLRSDELHTIIFANGSIKIYDQPTAKQEKITSIDTTSIVPIVPGLHIDKRGDYYYLGDQRMTEDEYLTFIEQNCQEAWDSYDSGAGLWSKGWKLFASGLGIGSAGFTFCMVAAFHVTRGYSTYGYSSYGASNNTDSIFLGHLIPGVFFAVVGGCLLTASIPCLAVGSTKKKNSYEVYNEKCAGTQQAKNTPITFGVTIGNNGVGVAMNF